MFFEDAWGVCRYYGDDPNMLYRRKLRLSGMLQVGQQITETMIKRVMELEND